MRRKQLQTLVLIIFALVLQMAAAERKDVPKRVDEILAQPDVARGFWGMEVVSLDTGKTVYSLNADKLFTPASNTKLFTTAAAFALIGPDYRYRTTVETAGTLDKYGRLTGDLLLVGRGDPNLSGRTLPYNLRTERKMPPLQALEYLADQVVARGVKVIEGDVVGDDRFYAFERYADGWSQEDLVREWGAPVSALTINDNVLFVNFLPGERPGERAFVSITPYADYYRIDNRIMTTPAGTGPRRIDVTHEPGTNLVTLWGNIPLDDPGANDWIAIDDPADFAARAFSAMLQRRGVVIYGRTRTQHTEVATLSTVSVTTLASGGGTEHSTPPVVQQPTVLAAHDSAPITDDLRVVNKVSQNLHAELTLRLLGREKGSAGTIEAGLEVIRGWLLQADIRPEEYAFFDGSGLSRQNLVTPAAMVKLLKFVNKQPWSQQFVDTLPVGGVDGSLQDRFKSTTLMGRVHAKTGSLGHVNALSGYATTVKGEHLAFSIMTNNHTLPPRKAMETIDAIIGVIVDDQHTKK